MYFGIKTEMIYYIEEWAYFVFGEKLVVYELLEGQVSNNAKPVFKTDVI